MTSYPTTYLVSDPQGRPSVKTDNVNAVISLLEQGWTAVRALHFSDEMRPVERADLHWRPEPGVIRSTIMGRIDARLGLGTR